MSGDLTPEDVRHWDLSVIHQVFETAAKRRGSKHQLGEALGHARTRTEDWHGESGDAFREELGKTRADVNAAGRESDRVYSAARNAEMWVSGAKVELADVDAGAETYGWTVTPGWKIDGGDNNTNWMYDPLVLSEEQQRLQEELDKAHSDAQTADHELATALRGAVGDAQLDEHGHEVPQAPGPQKTPDTVPGPHNGDPAYQTGLKPTLAGDPNDRPPMSVPHGSSDTVQLTDNPPGYSGPAGVERDKAWQAYLSQHDAATAGAVSNELRLPNPDAVSDPGLKAVGAAAKQQGVSYAWGGGHVEGKTGVSPGWAQKGDRSETYQDGNRTGFDCAGLARFATDEGHGFDISKGNDGNTVGQYAALTAPGGHGTKIPDSLLKPGDLIYFGTPGDSEHVAVYAGNGLVIQAHQSGEPVEVSPLDVHWQHQAVHVGN